MVMAADAAYAAGLFDGEGTLALLPRVRMAVKMTDRGPVQAMQDILGGHIYQWQDTGKGRPTYEWRAAGWDGTLEAIEAIQEFSKGKSRQLQVVSNYAAYKDTYGYSKDVLSVANNQLLGLREPIPSPITFDIETMGLDSTTLPMLSCSMLPADLEQKVFHTDPSSELSKLVATRTILEGAAYTIGWCSVRFDIPYINTRLALYQERPMFLGCHEDGQLIFDKKFGNKKRTSLQNAATQLGLVDENAHKTPIDWGIWAAASAGDPDAMSYVYDHAKNDVILTKRVYNAVAG